MPELCYNPNSATFDRIDLRLGNNHRDANYVMKFIRGADERISRTKPEQLNVTVKETFGLDVQLGKGVHKKRSGRKNQRRQEEG